MTDKVGQLTDYKTIADRLVERGIGRKIGDGASFWKFTYGTPDPETICTAEYFCHDWRVAGQCMERMGGIYAHCEPHIKGWWVYMETDKAVRLPVEKATNENDSLPLAIILAYLEATDG